MPKPAPKIHEMPPEGHSLRVGDPCCHEIGFHRAVCRFCEHPFSAWSGPVLHANGLAHVAYAHPNITIVPEPVVS